MFKNIIIIVLLIALLICILNFAIYRRQIKNICRQLAFIYEEESNIKISSTINTSEIRELIETYEKLNQKIKTERTQFIKKDRELKQALASVSHDIRTPLTSIKGYFQLIQDGATREERADYEKIINERLDVLSLLLEDLFTFTKLINEDYKMELCKQNVTKPILDTIFSFYNEIEEMGIEVEMQVDDRPYEAFINEIAIKRVASNIVKNTIIHGYDKLLFGYNVVDDKICFYVENTVEHPEKIDVDQVFERFYKADKARSKASTGLGLAISREYMEHMNGKIMANLLGNRFRITIMLDLYKD